MNQRDKVKRNQCSNFEIVEDSPDRLTIRDLGPWHKFRTVTNDAENVVPELFRRGLLPPGKRLFYFDSHGDLDEILHADGRFTGFWPGTDRPC